MKYVVTQIATISVLGISAFVLSGVLLSLSTKKTFLGIVAAPRELVVAPENDASKALCPIPETKRTYFVSCGGFF